MIPDKLKKKLDRFCDEAEALYGSNLKSIALYGSAASGEFAAKHSDINILIVLEGIDFATLSRSVRFFHKWKRIERLSPLLLDEKYIKSSVDVFPMEFLDMKENNVLLRGKDLLKDLTIDLKNLRFQCEQELKGKFLKLRQGYLDVGAKGRHLKRLIDDSIPAFITIFRNMLRLKGITPPIKKDRVIKETAKAFGIEESTGLHLLDIKMNRAKVPAHGMELLISDWLVQLEKLAEAIDV